MDKDKLQLRRQIDQLFNMIEETQKLAQTTARAQDTRHTAIMPGETVQILDADGNVAAYFGGSNESGQLIEYVAGPEPKQPSEPELDSPMPGVLTVIADGLDVEGEPAQGNHARVLIHTSHVEFTPDESTVTSSFIGPEGRQDVAAEPGIWYVAIQWQTQSGQLSEPSEVVEIEIEQLVNSADIQAALDEAQTRLDEARVEFEEMDAQRRQEIENLNDVVLPAIEETLREKADTSALGDLDATLRQAFGEADEAIRQVADDARARAEAAGATAAEADEAAAKAVADAEEAKAEAEAAKEYADQQDAKMLAAAAADAQEKADEAIRQARDLIDGAVTGGSNLIQDGGFEEGDENWSTTENQFTISTPEARTGSRVMLLDVTQGNRWPRSAHPIPVEQGRHYRFAAYVRVPEGGPVRTGFVAYVEHDDGTSSPVIYSTDIAASDEWTLIECIYEVPYSGARYVRPAVWAEHTSGSYVWVDDFTMHDVTEAAAALAAAGAAQSKADEAHANAGKAQDSADAAMRRAAEVGEAADNLPKVLHGTDAPSGTAPDGSIWYQHKGSLQGNVTAQWNRVNGQWVSTPIDSEAIANLDVGKLTAGGAVIADAVIQDLSASKGVFDRLDAREGWIGGVALKDDAVTARAVNVEDVFSDEVAANTIWTENLHGYAATLSRAIVASQNLIPGMSRINEATPPPFKSDFGRNSGHPSIWVRSGDSDHGDNTLTTSGDDDALIHLEASEVYRFRVGVSASKSGTTAYMALADENGNRVNVTRNGSNSSYLLVNHEAGSTPTRPEYYEAEIIPPYSGAFRLIFYASHTNGAPNPGSYQWFHGLTIANMLDGRLLVDGTVDARAINGESVTAEVAKFLEVDAGMIKANSITSEKIASGAINASHIAANSITGKEIDAGAIRAEHVDAERFSLTSPGASTRTHISAYGVEVIEDWSTYPDRHLQDPDLLAARHWVLDGWKNYQLSDANGNPLFPDTRRFTVRFRVTVHSMTGLEVRAHTRDVPEASSAYWTGSWHQTITAPGKYYLSLSAHDTYPYFAWLGLKGEVTLDEMWFEPRHNITALPVLSVTKDGLKAWDSSGSETASIGSGGKNFIAGRLFTNSPGQPGVMLNEDYGPDSSQGAGVWLTDDGTAGGTQAAIWATKDVPSGKYTQLNVRAPKGGELTLRGGNVIRSTEQHQFNKSVEIKEWMQVRGASHFQDETYFNDSAQFNGAIRVEGWIRNPGRPTRTSGANVFMGGTGEYLWKNTSVRRSKVNIETVEGVHHRLLDLNPRIWLDRTDIEMQSEACADLIEDTDEGPRVDEGKLSELFPDGELPRRVPGLVAEEVEAVGLEDYVVYEVDEETGEEKLQSVSYDRLWTLLIPLVREQRDEIAELKQQNEDLETRLANLEAMLNHD